MIKWRNDPKIYNWCRQFEPISEQAHMRWFESIQSDSSIRMYLIKANSTQFRDSVVGVAGLTSIDYLNSRAEFSLYIGPEFHGWGLGHESLLALCHKGFNELNLNLIWGETFDGNPAAGTFEKLGFRKEGTRRSFYFRQGRYIDAHLYSLLAGEFNANI